MNTILFAGDSRQCQTLIIPTFSSSEDGIVNSRDELVRIFAGMKSLKVSFEQVSLDLKDTEKRMIRKFFFLVKSPTHLSDIEFENLMQTICSYFNLNVRCLMKKDEQMVYLKILNENSVKEINTELTKLSDILISEFWELYLEEGEEVVEIRRSNSKEMVTEPQTNFGRLARDLKIKEVLKELSL